jgi:hypothetical protein
VKRVLVGLVVLLTLLAPSLALGQGTPAQPPKPGPEHQKLAGFVGNWTTEGEITENPFGPSEKWSAKITAEWFSGHFAVVRHVDGTGSVTGENHGLDVIAYDSEAKAYTWYGVDNQGWTGLAKASISGDVLTAVWKIQAKGKAYTSRGTLKGLGSDRLTWVQEYSEDGKTWKAFFHATDTRVKSK